MEKERLHSGNTLRTSISRINQPLTSLYALYEKVTLQRCFWKMRLTRDPFVSERFVKVFLGVLRARAYVTAAFLGLMVAGIYGAVKIPTDSAIERLVVAGDPVVRATQDFERLFPDVEHALLMLEAPDPLNLESLQATLALEQQLGRIPNVQAHSLLAVYPHLGSSAGLTPERAEKIRAFAI